MRKVSRKIIFICILLAIEVCITLYGLFTMPTWGDESAYHVPLAQTINWPSIISGNSNYSSAYTPIPYLIGNIFYRIFPSLYMLRFLNWLVVLISVFIFYKIAERITPEIRWESTLLFTANPYLLRASLMYVMFSYGLIFALAGIYIYFYSSVKYPYLWANICWGLAVLSMQWMLVLYAAYLLYELNSVAERQTDFKDTIKRLIVSFLTLLPALLLFWQWQGLTHPNFQTHTLRASLAHVNSVLAVIGFTFFVYSVFNIFQLSYKQWRTVVVLLFLTPVIFLGQPQHSSTHGSQILTGVVSAFFKKIEILIGFPYAISMTFFSVMGLGIIYIMFRHFKDDVEYFLLLVITGLFVAFAVSTKLGASHVFVVIPFLLLYFIKNISKQKFIVWLMGLQWYVTTIIYILYIIVIRSTGTFFID